MILARVLEPEVMDAADEADQYDAMDHSAVNALFVADLARQWPTGQSPELVEVLDLGTGTARIPLELATQFPQARIVAVDLAQPMLDLAARHIAGAGLSNQIRVERADVKRLDFADQQFAGVMSNSLLHHLAEPGRALAEAVRVCRIGGWLFFRDLLRPDDDQQVQRLVDQYCPTASAQQTQLFDASLRAALTLDEMRALVASAGLPIAAVRRTSDRHWTLAARRS